MPYPTNESLPPAVKDKIKSPKKRRQWRHVWNAEYKAHGDEGRAFASAWAAVEKNLSKGLSAMSDFNLFLPLSKVEKQADGSVIVAGYASTESLDLDGEIVSKDAIQKALPGYWEWRNIREMHQPSAVGVAKEANMDDTGLFLTAKITDPVAAQKCLDQVYKGYSVGGKKLAKKGNTITEIELVEVSIVDRPANPDCRINVAKSARKKTKTDGAVLLKVGAVGKGKNDLAKALNRMSKVAENLSKVDDITPAKHPKIPPTPPERFNTSGSPPVKCAKHAVENCAKCAAKAAKRAKKAEKRAAKKAARVAKGGNRPGEGKLPYGDVTYADPGYQKDKKKRYPLDTDKHIRAAWGYINKPKNAGKYSPEHLASIKSKIRAAMKRIGAEVEGEKATKFIDPELLRLSASSAELPFLSLKKGKGGKRLRAAERALKTRDETELFPEWLSSGGNGSEFDKGMQTAGSLSYCFDSLRDTQRALMLEAEREGGDKKDAKFAKELGGIARQISSIIEAKAAHEGREALDFSDADDKGLMGLFSEDMKMAKRKNASLDETLVKVFAKAAALSRKKRMQMAQGDMRKAAVARKRAREAVEEAHKMLKGAYLNKAAKARKGEATGTDEDISPKVMSKLSKAYSEIEKTGTFLKAAREQMKKVARSGQKEQEPSHGAPGYKVPPGVEDLSPDAMATAGGTSMPPAYPGSQGGPGPEAVYGGKMAKYAGKDGKIDAAVAELLAENARLGGQREALSARPGQRPYAFDMNKFAGAAGGGVRSADPLTKAVMDAGVDPSLLIPEQEQDNPTARSARSKVAGMFIANPENARPAYDPQFRGAAIGARS